MKQHRSRDTAADIAKGLILLLALKLCVAASRPSAQASPQFTPRFYSANVREMPSTGWTVAPKAALPTFDLKLESRSDPALEIASQQARSNIKSGPCAGFEGLELRSGPIGDLSQMFQIEVRHVWRTSNTAMPGFQRGTPFEVREEDATEVE